MYNLQRHDSHESHRGTDVLVTRLSARRSDVRRAGITLRPAGSIDCASVQRRSSDHNLNLNQAGSARGRGTARAAAAAGPDLHVTDHEPGWLHVRVRDSGPAA